LTQHAFYGLGQVALAVVNGDDDTNHGLGHNNLFPQLIELPVAGDQGHF
jgi:hypothetical protein